MNKRLAGDETEDPKHKKIQFPSKVKCPKCYKSSIIDSVISDSSLFDTEETFKYLLSFYTVGNILGVEKEAMVKEKLDSIVNHHSSHKATKRMPTEPTVGVRDNLKSRPGAGAKPVHVDEIIRIPDPINEAKQPLPKHGDRNRVDYDLVRDNMLHEDHTKHLDFYLSIIVYILVFVTFACFYFYYKLLRKRSYRAKKKSIL